MRVENLDNGVNKEELKFYKTYYNKQKIIYVKVV